MLNLFKFPFRVNKSSKLEDSSFDIAAGLMRNYMRNNRDLSEAELDRAWEEILEEMDMLQQRLEETETHDQYELMQMALKNIERKLDRS